jgi:hypothetical protein
VLEARPLLKTSRSRGKQEKKATNLAGFATKFAGCTKPPRRVWRGNHTVVVKLSPQRLESAHCFFSARRGPRRGKILI